MFTCQDSPQVKKIPQHCVVIGLCVFKFSGKTMDEKWYKSRELIRVLSCLFYFHIYSSRQESDFVQYVICASRGL